MIEIVQRAKAVRVFRRSDGLFVGVEYFAVAKTRKIGWYCFRIPTDPKHMGMPIIGLSRSHARRLLRGEAVTVPAPECGQGATVFFAGLDDA